MSIPGDVVRVAKFRTVFKGKDIRGKVDYNSKKGEHIVMLILGSVPEDEIVNPDQLLETLGWYFKKEEGDTPDEKS